MNRNLKRTYRKGIIEIPADFIDDISLPKIFQRLEFIPLDVTFMVDLNTFRMLGTSHFFDEVKLGSPTPTYNVIVVESGGGAVQQVKVEKCARA